MMMTNQNIGKLKVTLHFDDSQRMLRSIHWLCQYMDRCRIPRCPVNNVRLLQTVTFPFR